MKKQKDSATPQKPKVRGWLASFNRALGAARVRAFEAELKSELESELSMFILKAHIRRCLEGRDLQIGGKLLETCLKAGVAAGLKAGLEAGLVAGLNEWVDYSDRDIGLNWGEHVGTEISQDVGRKAAIRVLENSPQETALSEVPESNPPTKPNVRLEDCIRDLHSAIRGTIALRQTVGGQHVSPGHLYGTPLSTLRYLERTLGHSLEVSGHAVDPQPTEDS